MSYDFFQAIPAPAQGRFALRLRMLRSASGLTPQGLAQKAGLDLARYRDFESGKALVTAAALVRVMDALGMDPALMFDPD